MKAADSSGDRERQVQESPLTRPTINKAKNSYASLVSHVNDTVVTPLADHRMAGKDREECTFEIKIPSWANQGRIGGKISPLFNTVFITLNLTSAVFVL
jgi:hypothetical protein